MLETDARQKQTQRRDPAKVVFFVSAFLLVFLYGTAVGRYKIFPFEVIQYAQDSVDLVLAERETLLKQRPAWLLQKARYEGDGVTRFVKAKAAPGLTLLSGLFDDNLELRLIEADGSIVARWPVQFSGLFPDTTFIQPAGRVPQTDWNTNVHGSRLLPDGSLVFTFEAVGAARLDRCGAVEWTLPEMTHHTVSASARGTFWIPGMRHVLDDMRFPGLDAPYDEDLILEVSPEGKVLRKISVLDLFSRKDLRALLFANGIGTPDVPGSHTPTHLNDVEELTPAMAAKFSNFSAGDLLLSLRNYNLLMVIDPDTGVVKWHQVGPWLKQHDPDFQADGTISVFSNNTDTTFAGTILGGSTIIDFTPFSRGSKVRYGGRPDQKLFTNVRGMHQRQPNGNELIAEAHAGRVIEVTPSGEIVWEFINRYDAETVAIVTGATRYPYDYFTVTDWSCRADSSETPAR